MVGTVIWRATGDHDVVEDLAQETFLRVFRGLPYFDQRAKLSTWIYTIAHRVAIDHRRQTGRRSADANEAALRIDDQPSSGLNPELAATRSEPIASSTISLGGCRTNTGCRWCMRQSRSSTTGPSRGC